MGLFNSSERKKSNAGFGHDPSDHRDYHTSRRSSFARHDLLERDFRIRNPYHRTLGHSRHQPGFVEDTDHHNPHGHRSSRRESHDHSRSRRSGAPSLSPTRATYENQHYRSAYRRQSPAPASSRSRQISSADFHSTPFRSQSGRQRSASPGRSYSQSTHQRHRRHDEGDGGLAERLAGFSMGGEERKYGRRRLSFTTKVERIFDL